jgi:dTDP-4-amino-4,6-dideoxygalactose transaminase
LDLILPPVVEYGESVHHQFTVCHPQRDALREHLTRQGVGTDTIYPIPLHLQPCYADLRQPAGSLPFAEAAARTVLSLPIFPELTDGEIDHVIAAVNRF